MPQQCESVPLLPAPEGPQELPQAGERRARDAPPEEDGPGLQTGLSGPRPQPAQRQLVGLVYYLGLLVGLGQRRLMVERVASVVSC